MSKNLSPLFSIVMGTDVQMGDLIRAQNDPTHFISDRYGMKFATYHAVLAHMFGHDPSHNITSLSHARPTH